MEFTPKLKEEIIDKLEHIKLFYLEYSQVLWRKIIGLRNIHYLCRQSKNIACEKVTFQHRKVCTDSSICLLLRRKHSLCPYTCSRSFPRNSLPPLPSGYASFAHRSTVGNRLLVQFIMSGQLAWVTDSSLYFIFPKFHLLVAWSKPDCSHGPVFPFTFSTLSCMLRTDFVIQVSYVAWKAEHKRNLNLLFPKYMKKNEFLS